MIDSVRRRSEFTELRRHGSVRRFGPISTVTLQAPQRARPALGVVTPRAVGNSVARNRLRRQTRAAFADAVHSAVQAPCLMLVIHRHAGQLVTFQQIRSAIQSTFDSLSEFSTLDRPPQVTS